MFISNQTILRMKLRSGKITIPYLKQLSNHMTEFEKINQAVIDNLIDVVYNGAVEKDFSNKKAAVVNKIYSLFSKKFDELHSECIENFINREDAFIKLISSLEINSKVILKDIEENSKDKGVKRKLLKNNVMKAVENAKNHIKTLQTDKNNLLCRVSCKVGSDLAINISSYLS